MDGGPTIDQANILGVEVSAINRGAALASIECWIASRRRHHVCITGVHGVMESQRDPKLRRIHNAAGMVTPDGMPLMWLLWASGHRNADRVWGTSWRTLCAGDTGRCARLT